MGWKELEVSCWVKDVTIPIFTKRVKCSFYYCKTCLNQSNLKVNDFCYVHQRAVTILLSMPPAPDRREEWEVYKKLVKGRERQWHHLQSTQSSSLKVNIEGKERTESD